MIAGTGSAFSGCCGVDGWLCGFAGSADGVAVGAGAGVAGVEACCCGVAAVAVGAMACTGGCAAFLLSVLSHEASNKTTVPKIVSFTFFMQKFSPKFVIRSQSSRAYKLTQK